LEAKVFLLGIYKNYDDLEENMSMPELLLTLEASEKASFQDRRFSAALKGVDLEDPFVSSNTSLDDIKKRIAAKNSDFAPDDAVLIANEIGLGYETV
jgi:hypothetical protein